MLFKVGFVGVAAPNIYLDFPQKLSGCMELFSSEYMFKLPMPINFHVNREKERKGKQLRLIHGSYYFVAITRLL